MNFCVKFTKIICSETIDLMFVLKLSGVQIGTYLKDKNSPQTTQFSSLKYVFTAFKKKIDAKLYIFFKSSISFKTDN